MIRYAGLGVAMGNASDEVKEAANYITDTNNQAGVGKAIRKFCL
jgi:hydroxymethylpyrimidine pyrophosphatase-like HAD family hydrolase